jgi:Protein of unknown function (DUF3761)
MEPNANKKWYQKKWLVASLGFFIVLIVIGLSSQDQTSQNNSINSNTQSQVKGDTVNAPSHVAPFLINQQSDNTPQQTTQAPAPTPAPKYYINSSGNTVQSPTKTQDNSIPAGATARCRDSSYSFSQHRSGTCSHHGGVAQWLN